jgi:hypothetical protein
VRTCLICRFAQKANHVLVTEALREHGDTRTVLLGTCLPTHLANQIISGSESMSRSGKVGSISVIASEVRVSRARSHRSPCFRSRATTQAKLPGGR